MSKNHLYNTRGKRHTSVLFVLLDTSVRLVGPIKTVEGLTETYLFLLKDSQFVATEGRYVFCNIYFFSIDNSQFIIIGTCMHTFFSERNSFPPFLNKILFF